MKTFFVLCLTATGFCALAQQKIRGRVVAEGTREPLELAFVHIPGNNDGAVTDNNGYFLLTLENTDKGHAGELQLEVSHIGYSTKTISIAFGNNQPLLIELDKAPVDLKEVVIRPQASSAAFHTISRIDLDITPVRSAQDILRIVPGLFIGQHQGGGKAEQIFLRGFDIDHGTDINITVDGLPVNMVSHAHGQGYADLHFLIPELTAKVDYGKGPYYSEHGNLGTAGYVSLQTLNSLEHSSIKLEGGQFNTFRGLAMIDLLGKKLKSQGTNAYVAGEFLYSDGPFDAPQHFNRFNLFGKFNTRLGSHNKITLVASTLNSDWDASGQIPERAVKEGLIGRFGAIDSTEGGYTSRTNISATLSSYLRNGDSWENLLYYSRYNFNLHSDFTFFLDDPVNGDQIRQREGRNLYGFRSVYRHMTDLGRWQLNSAWGAMLRHDGTRNSELSHTVNRNTVLDYKQLGDIRETNAAVYADESFRRGNWLVNTGVRLDYFQFDYFDRLTLSSYPAQSRFIASPKLNIQYTVNPRTQIYVKAGKGFHSNDARVVVMNQGRDILPAAYGTDLGIFLKPAPRLIINAALWYLYLQQEFVYVGDEGVVEPSGRTRRVGMDLSARYQLTDWLFADLNLNLARPRSVEEAKGQDYIPLAPTLTSTGGLSWKFGNKMDGSIRYRYMKERPANEDNSVVASGYTVTDFAFNYNFRRFTVGLAIENLFDVEWNETQFDTESRLQNEPAPVSEIHFTPGVPFYARMRVSYTF